MSKNESILLCITLRKDFLKSAPAKANIRDEVEKGLSSIKAKKSDYKIIDNTNPYLLNLRLSSKMISIFSKQVEKRCAVSPVEPGQYFQA